MPVFVLRHILCKDNLPESIQSGALCTWMCTPEPCFISGIGSNVFTKHASYILINYKSKDH